MIVGNPNRFALESVITTAFQRPSLRGVGFFCIHIDGRSFGVRTPDATMLACSFDAVSGRIARRGEHRWPFRDDPEGAAIASAFRRAVYGPDHHDADAFFGVTRAAFIEAVTVNALCWAPDGDEAFDDGSHVLHLDHADTVRLIAFRSWDQDAGYDPATLREVTLRADEFYEVLGEWRQAFEAEWVSLPKADA